LRGSALLLVAVSCAACASPRPPAPTPTPRPAVCGDGIVEAGEECDDANSDDADGCLRTCLKAARFVASDPHIHSNGCGGDLTPSGLLAVSASRGTQVTAALVWGDGYHEARRYFTGRDDPASQPDRIIHYDLEVSHFPAAETGHLVILGLSNIDFSPDPFRRPGSGIPVADWALAQGPRVVVGMAHGEFWPADGRFPSPPQVCCMPWDFAVDAIRGRVTFIGTERRGLGPPVDAGTLRLWKAVENAGARVSLTGASDYPCIHHVIAAETPRTDVILDGEISYDRWLEALRAGRTSVALGQGNHLNLRLDGVGPGGELKIAGGQVVHASVEGTGAIPYTVQIMVNGSPVGGVNLDAGTEALPIELHLEKSAWVSALSPWVMTTPVYVVVDDQPIRGPAEDICYLIRYVDHLEGLVRSRRIETGAEQAVALAAYDEARATLVTRFTEAGGASCP
jgi:cysteine-rich repeat protein